jgi:hypothetical protein
MMRRDYSKSEQWRKVDLEFLEYFRQEYFLRLPIFLIKNVFIMFKCVSNLRLVMWFEGKSEVCSV